MTEQSPSAVVTDVIFMVLGTVLLLASADVLSLRWDLIGPVLLVIGGAAVMLTGLVRGRTRDHT